jgi:hypothetical protein
MSATNHNVDEVTADLRSTTITAAESTHVTADLRKPIVTKATTKSEVSATNTASAANHTEHDCPGHYILNGGIALVSDDARVFITKSKEIKEILDTIMPGIADKLNSMKIGLRISFAEKIGMFKCNPAPAADKEATSSSLSDK